MLIFPPSLYKLLAHAQNEPRLHLTRMRKPSGSFPENGTPASGCAELERGTDFSHVKYSYFHLPCSSGMFYNKENKVYSNGPVFRGTQFQFTLRHNGGTVVALKTL